MGERFVGIDWGHRELSVAMVDEAGERVWEREYARDGEGIAALCTALSEGGEVARTHVALEMPRAAVIEALLDRGFPLYSINPKQADRFRDRHTVSGAKDDARDAFVLADALRTDRRLFHRLLLEEEHLVTLRALSRGLEALTKTTLDLANQVLSHLRYYFPELAALGDWHREPWLLELFELAPTPTKAKALRVTDIKNVLREHGIRRHKGKALREMFRSFTPLPAAPGVAEAYAKRVAMLLPVLRAAIEQRRAAEAELQAFVKELAAGDEDEEPTDMAILLSMPGVGVKVAATLAAEAAPALAQRDYDGLRRLCGTAPVTKRSGGRHKTGVVSMRRACNARLREAVYHLGRVAAQNDERSKAHYRALRARGKDHGRAVRGVADRLLKVLITMLKSGTLYDPSRRRALRPEAA